MSRTLSVLEAAAVLQHADFMINIQMLVWGAQHVGPVQDLRMDMNPSDTWLDMAMQHARQVAANHVRPDGSTYHIVEYNPNTGGLTKNRSTAS